MRRVALAAAVLALSLSCTTSERLAPTFDLVSDLTISSLPAVRISEIHYDNVGTDAGEAIEVSGPAGTDLTGWSIVLYNGSGGAVYDTDALPTPIPATCDTRGVVVLNYPANGIQNGSPDGVALVDASGAVVEFLSYEGTFTAVGGPANGLVSVSISVSEAGGEPLGQSLQRNGADVWSGPSASTFGACNDNELPPPPPPPAGPVNIVEIHYDNNGADAGEAVEVEGPAGQDLTGWTVVLYNGNGGLSYGTLALSGLLTDQCGGRGVASIAAVGLQNGPPDGLALVDAGGIVVEFLSYEGTFTATNGPANGQASVDIRVAEEPPPPGGQSLQKDAGGWYGPAAASFGACNVKPPPPASTITIVGRNAGDPALPVGFQDQLFATLLDGSGNPVPTATFIWASETPALASIDQNGVFTALGEGTAVLRATAHEGTTRTISLPTRVAVASTTALYAGNAEFGEPADADPSDDFIVRHEQYTTSYNPNRGTPNWVSYDLEATHFGPEDRCDCFTFDSDLPGSFTHYTTADYTGAGAFHGYGIDRGHLARSFDRTSASLDNARTFLFTNIVPQAADLNQGPWAIMENFLGDLARFSNKEVYIIAGVAGNKGTIKNEGKIAIPAFTWKVALVLPRDHGLADVHSYQDVEAIAVIMPNEPGVRDVNWETYKTTVDAVEALSGYDVLALLPDPVEIAVESNTQPPAALTDGPYESLPNIPTPMNGGGSSDPDGDALTYAWTFGDGSAAAGTAVSHTYASAGTFNVRLIVTDIRGLADTAFTTAVIATPQQAIAEAQQELAQLVAAGALDAGEGRWHTDKLGNASKLLEQATVTAAVTQLDEIVRRLERTGAGASDYADTVRQIIQSLTA